MTDSCIEETFRETSLLQTKEGVEEWLRANVWSRYRGPLGVDLMVCGNGGVYVAEVNFRHTMGMIAHERIKNEERK